MQRNKMSEFHVNVIKLGVIEPHPSADRLEVTRVHGGYPCIIKKGNFQPGDLAIYVPIDTVLPDTEHFAFLSASDRKRLRAKKLRGVLSMGLIIPAEHGMVEGQDVAQYLGITKYEPPNPLMMGGQNESPPVGWDFVKYTDIDGLRRYLDILQVGEEVVATEKIHGANGRFVHDGARLWVGSRTCIKRRDPGNVWWQVAINLELESRLAAAPHHIFFGEVFGPVQDLKYGQKSGHPAFRVFDIFDIKQGRYLDHDDAVALAEQLNLAWVPQLKRGCWDHTWYDLAEGNSTLASHVREGFVVKPVKERYNDRIGRVILKMHGEGYLTRKNS